MIPTYFPYTNARTTSVFWETCAIAIFLLRCSPPEPGHKLKCNWFQRNTITLSSIEMPPTAHISNTYPEIHVIHLQ